MGHTKIEVREMKKSIVMFIMAFVLIAWIPKEDSHLLTTHAFMKHYPIGTNFEKYAEDMIELDQKEKVYRLATLEVKNKRFHSEVMDIVKVKDGYMGIGFDSKKITGYWKFKSLEQASKKLSE